MGWGESAERRWRVRARTCTSLAGAAVVAVAAAADRRQEHVRLPPSSAPPSLVATPNNHTINQPNKHKENVAAESAMMVPETRQRLEAALTDLVAYLVRVIVAWRRASTACAAACFVLRSPRMRTHKHTHKP